MALLCLESGCKFSRKEHKDSETIRCFMCTVWFHVKCVNETHPEALYTCGLCKNVSSNIRSVMQCMSTLVEKLDKLNTDFDHMKTKQDTLMKQFNDINKENDTTKSDNALLRNEILTLRADLQQRDWPLQPSDSVDKPALFVGSSMLRDIDNDKISNAYVHSISGGKIQDVVTYLNDIPTGKYKSVTLLIGSNDCEDLSTSVTDITRNYTDLIQLAKSKVSETIIASILPRYCPDNTTVSERIDIINAELQVMCTENGSKFMNNNCAFKLQDGKINDGFYLPERHSGKLVHLNDRGTMKLCDLMGIKSTTNKVTKDRQRNKPQQFRNYRQGETAGHLPAPRDPPQVARGHPSSRIPPLPVAEQPNQRAPSWNTEPRPQHAPSRNVQQSQQHMRHNTVPDQRPPARAADPSLWRTQPTEPQRQYTNQADYYSPTQTQYTGYEQYRAPTPENTNRDQQYQYSEHQCYYCGERHQSHLCWYRERVLCVNCNTEGHKEKNCPRARDNHNSWYPRYTPSSSQELNYY